MSTPLLYLTRKGGGKVGFPPLTLGEQPLVGSVAFMNRHDSQDRDNDQKETKEAHKGQITHCGVDNTHNVIHFLKVVGQITLPCPLNRKSRCLALKTFNHIGIHAIRQPQTLKLSQ